MQKKENMRNGGALLRRALLAALLLAALGTGAVSAQDGQNTSALSVDEMDRAFATSVVAMTDEISSILKQWSATAKQGSAPSDFAALRSVGVNLSTRSRFWYDTLGAMPVSGRLADSKRSFLLGLKEFESAGDSTVKGMDFYLSGNDAAAVPLIVESGNQAGRGAEYFNTAAAQWPPKGNPTVTPTTTVTEPTPAPVTQPTGTLRSQRSWGRRYAVGNPGLYLGARAGQNKTGTATGRARAVGAPGIVLRPGSRSYGIAPPAGGSFVRWYPAARWGAGIR
jgi:hypothetical protein